MTVPNDIPKKVLGTVPISEDGSAVFRVPANLSLQVQTLDETGMALLTEKSLFYLQPGELRSCVGCHEPVGTAPSQAAIAKTIRMKPMELTPAAGPQYEGGTSFARTVQPVLDRYCIKCHGLEKTEKNVNLMYIKGKSRYPNSLVEIVKRGDHRVGDKGYMNGKYKGTKTNYNISIPRNFFAYSNSVAQKLAHGDKHHKKLIDRDRESYMRIIEWLDINGQCFGDLFPNRIEDRSFDANGVEALRSYIKELFGEKIASQPEYALVNVAQPDESRILLMPLPSSKGGWGQMEGFKSKEDPSYKKMAELVERCIKRRPNENTKGWNPTWAMGGADNWVLQERTKLFAKFNKTLKENPEPEPAE
jgi:cytochrome c553